MGSRQDQRAGRITTKSQTTKGLAEIIKQYESLTNLASANLAGSKVDKYNNQKLYVPFLMSGESTATGSRPGTSNILKSMKFPASTYVQSQSHRRLR